MTDIERKLTYSVGIAIPVSAVLAVAIFAVDLSIPLGVAGGVPYVAVILVTLWASRRITLTMAVVTSLLTILGYFFSPAGGELWQVLSNRFLALLAIWVTVFLTMLYKKANEKLQLHHDHLEAQVKQRTTRLAEANVTLRESEENFRTLFQFAPEPLLVVNANAEVLNLNKRFSELVQVYASRLNLTEKELQMMILSKVKINMKKNESGLIEISTAQTDE